jgi:hypothetical protein
MHEFWEPFGRQRELLDAELRLQHLLGIIDPGAWTPSEAAAYPSPPDWLTDKAQIENFHRARALFTLLEEAVAATSHACGASPSIAMAWAKYAAQTCNNCICLRRVIIFSPILPQLRRGTFDVHRGSLRGTA